MNFESYKDKFRNIALSRENGVLVATEKTVTAVHVSPGEALAAGLFHGWVNSQEWSNEAGYQVDMNRVRSYGIPLTSFAEWAHAHRSDVMID